MLIIEQQYFLIKLVPFSTEINVFGVQLSLYLYTSMLYGVWK